MLLSVITIFFLVLMSFHLSCSKKVGNLDRDKTKCTKGILALFIVLHHVSYVTTSVWLAEFVYWGNVVCGCFFFLSGYGLMKSLKVKGNLYLNNFLFCHFIKLFLPLILVAFVFALLYNILPSRIEYNILQDLFSGKTFVPNTWFVFALAILYVFFYVSYCVLGITIKSHVCLLILTIGYVLLSLFVGLQSYWYSSVLAFPLGVFIADKEKWLFRTKPLKVLGIVALLVGGALSMALYSLYISPMTYAPILCTIYPLFVYIMLLYIPMPANNKALKKLGDISYEVYIVHGIVVLYLLDLLNGVYLLFAVLGISIFISVYLNKVSAFYIKKIIKWRKIY